MDTGATNASKAALTNVLMVGIDSGSYDLIEALADAGRMPNFAKLREGALFGHTSCPFAVGNGAVWPTFLTARQPGEHPFYDGLRRFDPASYELRKFAPDEVDITPFWTSLDAAGKRCLIIDTPYCHVAPLQNGVMIQDWGGHVPSVGGRLEVRAHPPAVAQEVTDIVGADPVGGLECDHVKRETAAELAAFRDQLIDRAKKRAVLTKHFLGKGDWDYTEVVFSEAHCAGHVLWHIDQESHPDYDRKLAKKLGHPMADVYAAIDEAVGDILSLVDERTAVIVYCSHGMGPQYSATGLLDRILRQLELGVPAQPPRKSMMERARGAWLSIPSELRAPLAPLAGRFSQNMGLYPERYINERAGRRAFEVPVNNGVGGVRLNLKGREAEGIIEAEDYDATLAALAATLKKITKVETNESLVESIHRRDELFTGPFVADMPDLIVTYRRDTPITTVRSEEIGTLVQNFDGPRSGDHIPEGAFYAFGGGIKGGRLNSVTDPVDFAPTIGELLGAPIPGAAGTPIAGVQVERA